MTIQKLLKKMKLEELFYGRGDKSENYTMADLKTMIWRYYIKIIL